MTLRNKAKNNRFILFLYFNWTLFFGQMKKGVIKSVIRYFGVYKDYFDYRKLGANTKFVTNPFLMQPYYNDKTSTTPLDPVYFYQDTWCASKIFDNKPKSHVDVGSSAKTIGIISQYVPTTMVDIRPIELELKGLSFIEGSIVELPFEDNSIESLSSICVIEHIGLGRYGDPLDPFGSEKAINELKRVVRNDGYIYISVPVDDEAKCLFNNCRTFTRETIIDYFSGFELVDEKYQYGNSLIETFRPELGFGTGLFAFKKI